jgi:predicted nuclease with TOPRIM domain
MNLNNVPNPTHERDIATEFKELKSKYSNKVKENKFLKKRLNELTNFIDNFEDSYKSVQNMYSTMSEHLKTLTSSKSDMTFSTSFSPQEAVIVKNKISNSVLAPEAVCPVPHGMCVKKAEELEMQFYDMTKNFTNLVVKYKFLKEEKEAFEEINTKLLGEINNLRRENASMINDLNESYSYIERYKEIDRCLMESNLNSYILNLNDKKRDQSGNISQSNSYINCEPIPTFISFIKKFT